MNILQFIKLLESKLIYLIILPILAAVIVFFITQHLPLSYSTDVTLFTGITSNSGVVVDNVRVDNYATQNEYNNILEMMNSNDILEEVSIKLLTQHLLLSKPQKDIISENAFNDLNNITPEEVKKLIVKGNFNQSYKNLKNYVKQDRNNFIYSLLNFDNPYYSFKSLRNIKHDRLNNSDLIRISYQSSDPGISYNTVKFLSEVFIERYRLLKVTQTGSAVEYFELKLKESEDKINKAEDELMKFNIDNSIINYYEQTKQTTTQQQEIELRLQERKMGIESSKAVFERLDQEVSNRFKNNKRTTRILDLRNQIIDNANIIFNKELNNKTTDNVQLNNLKNKQRRLEEDLSNTIDSVYIFESKSQGVESQKMLGEWLDALKDYVGSSAIYKSMLDRHKDFLKQYKLYAPLGATVAHIEREIDVNEREYIEILHNLSLAKLKQQNGELLSKMTIIAEPIFPINANPSKRKVYIIIGALLTLVLYIIGILLVELSDRRVRTPEKLEKLSGMEVIGAYCDPKIKNESFSSNEISKKSSAYLYEKIRVLLAENNFVKIQVFSNWKNTETQMVSELLDEELRKHGYTGKIINIVTDVNSDNDILTYYKTDSYEKIVKGIDQSDYIIVVLPPVSEGLQNQVLLKQGDFNIFVFDADTTWMNADTFNVKKIIKAINTEIFAVLTNAIPDNLEYLFGEIPKKRSMLRVATKNIIKRFA